MSFNTISMFSGALGLDIGLEKAGLDIKLACEYDKDACDTIRSNKPLLPLLSGDVRDYSSEDVLEASGLDPSQVFLICGGPPCQAFSTAGRRLGFNDDRGNVFLKFIQFIEEIKPKYFLIENVRGLLSAPLEHRPHSQRGFGYPPLTPQEKKGGALLYIIGLLESAGYEITFTLYDASHYGAPQKRERVVMLGSSEGLQIPLIPPTHSSSDPLLKNPVTVRDTIGDLQGKKMTCLSFPEKRLVYYRMLKEGEYWKNLPEELQKEALGASFFAGGGKTGFLRRLAWDKPSPTLVTCPTMPATDLCHPVEDRPLSVEEYKRIQEFPDDWIISGDIKSQYRQIGNAVPISLATAAGRHLIWFDGLSREEKQKLSIVNTGIKYSRYRDTDHVYFKNLKQKAESHNCTLFDYEDELIGQC